MSNGHTTQVSFKLMSVPHLLQYCWIEAIFAGVLGVDLSCIMVDLSCIMVDYCGLLLYIK